MDETQQTYGQAAALMGLWGTGTEPELWRGFEFADDHAPGFMERSHGMVRSDYRTVLVGGFSDVEPPGGWEIVASYAVGEAACPQCGDGSGNEHRRSECDLCRDGISEPDGLIYWGDDWRMVVFGPIAGTQAKHHTIDLTDGEAEAIEWAYFRYGWGDLHTYLCVDESDDEREIAVQETRRYSLTNQEALEWVRAAGEDDTPYACAAPRLEAKLRALATAALRWAERDAVLRSPGF